MANSLSGFGGGEEDTGRKKGGDVESHSPDVEQDSHTKWDRGNNHMVECKLIKIG